MKSRRKRGSRAGRSARRWHGRAGGWWKPTRESQVSMSHVDDGILHGYLDGELAPAEAREVDAHLAQCPECRRRVDEERALIARAAELLAVATPPDRALPPFRAGDVKAPTRLWWQVRLPLAWAATVALALGIGTYLGRDVQRAPEAEAARSTAATPSPTRAESPKQELARRETRVAAPGAARTPPAAPLGPPQPRARVDNIALPPPRAGPAGSPGCRGGRGQSAA